MLLRSITQHVKDQNWFAIFLDLLIVIFGVFIGIQVSNWNAELVGNKQAHVLIERLYKDLKNDKLTFETELNYQSAVRHYAMTAVDALNGENSVSDEQFVIGAYQASQINGVWSNRATYNEMLSTGQINLIQNERLKVMIFGYFSTDFSQNTQMTTIAPYRQFIRGLMPILIQDTIKEECGDVAIEVAGSFASMLPATCDLQLPDALIRETASLLRSQSEMLTNLQYQIAVYDTQVFNIINFEKETYKLMAAIKDIQQ
jgi:hypothetical protein